MRSRERSVMNARMLANSGPFAGLCSRISPQQGGVGFKRIGHHVEREVNTAIRLGRLEIADPRLSGQSGPAIGQQIVAIVEIVVERGARARSR